MAEHSHFLDLTDDSISGRYVLYTGRRMTFHHARRSGSDELTPKVLSVDTMLTLGERQLALFPFGRVPVSEIPWPTVAASSTS